MRIMMEENQIHHDVISKLWQVYSMYSLHFQNVWLLMIIPGKERHLPKPQRRGAIIILGMLAVAKRSVLTDKVDVLLRIGLGPLGRVRFFYDEFTIRDLFLSRLISFWHDTLVWLCSASTEA